MAERRQRSPLHGRQAGPVPPLAGHAAGIALRERAFQGHLDLRGDPASASFVEAAESALGSRLALEPNTVTTREGLSVLWLAPDEWLLLTAPERAEALASALRGRLAGEHFALNDLSGGQTIINLTGLPAGEVLAKGCSLDVHPRAFVPGQCAQTPLARANVVLRPLSANLPSFDVIVRRSFADYLWRWLADAAREYGLL